MDLKKDLNKNFMESFAESIKEAKSLCTLDQFKQDFIDSNKNKDIKDIILAGFPDEFISNCNEVIKDNSKEKNSYAYNNIICAIKSVPQEKRRGVRLV